MFGSLGGAELLLILVLALLLFGPRKLPEIGRTLGRGLSEFRKATTEFKSTLQREVDLEDEVKEVKRTRDSLKQARRDLRQSITDASRLDLDAAAPTAQKPHRSSDDAAPSRPAPTADAPDPDQADAPDRREP